jgi:RNA polymerase sigma-70 factor (ECF subfamily)
MRQVGAGDRDAFARLYDILAGTVFGMIKRILRDHAMSEEVMQEVMLEVWRQAPRYDPDTGSAIAWILTMSHRRAVDRVRSEQSGRDRVSRIAVDERGHDSVVETVLQTAVAGLVRAALANLSDAQRQAIEMAYYDGLTQNEIAMRLDIPIGTVKTRIRDGMLRLRQTLGSAF